MFKIAKVHSYSPTTTTVHTSYNLNRTHMAHAGATRVAHTCYCHTHAITRNINYLHVQGYMRLHHPFACEASFYIHTRVLAVMFSYHYPTRNLQGRLGLIEQVIRVFTTCTSLDSSLRNSRSQTPCSKKGEAKGNTKLVEQLQQHAPVTLITSQCLIK